MEKKCRNKSCESHKKRKNSLEGSVHRKNMGAYSELLIVLDLFKKGYEVYRAVSQHCSGDIICEKDGHLIKIDATTGYINLNGSYSYPPKKHKLIIAVNLSNNGRIVYLEDGKEIEM